MDHDVASTIHEWVARKVAEGFEGRDEIIESVTDIVEDVHNLTGMTDAVARVTDDLLAQHYENQKSWISWTDCDKLDRSFAELEKCGIVARQHFSCCGECAETDILKEIEAASGFETPQGFAYYSVEDTESACEKGTLPLTVGSVAGTDDAKVEVARRTCDILAKHGLRIEWDGDCQNRICVAGLDWKKRRAVDERGAMQQT